MSTDTVTNDAERAAVEWPLRPWLLAGLLGLAGLLIHLVTQGRDDVPWQMALAAFLFFGSVSAALTLEERRWKEPAVFAAVIGLVMAGLAWRATQYGDSLPDEHYGFAAGVVATLLALPLYQAGFLRKRLATPYADTHYNVWSDAISGAGSVAFTGLSWLVLLILSELFHLLKIDLLRDAMEEGWFGWTFSGLAFGAALGTLRNQLKVLGTLQSVVLLVLSLLAVPLAVGLLLFLLATAVSGPQVLWEATRSATPVLLTCAAGAWVLANAILRDRDAAMSRSRVMRVAALVLAAVILPLAVFAAVSMGLRLNQYGLAPERLWGLVAILVACAYGLGFWVALIRGRKGGWAERLRSATFHLALGVLALALLLALPILDFGAISASNQVARLQSGKVTPDKFDFAALRWDFGEPGRKALERLARSDNAKVVELARIAMKQTQRPHYDRIIRTDEDFKLRVQPESAELRRRVLDHLRANPWLCSETCVALDLGGNRVGIVRGSNLQIADLATGDQVAPPPIQVAPADGGLKANSTVEIRPWTGRRVHVDGKPIGQPFE